MTVSRGGGKHDARHAKETPPGRRKGAARRRRGAGEQQPAPKHNNKAQAPRGRSQPGESARPPRDPATKAPPEVSRRRRYVIRFEGAGYLCIYCSPCTGVKGLEPKQYGPFLTAGLIGGRREGQGAPVVLKSSSAASTTPLPHPSSCSPPFFFCFTAGAAHLCPPPFPGSALEGGWRIWRAGARRAAILSDRSGACLCSTPGAGAPMCQPSHAAPPHPPLPPLALQAPSSPCPRARAAPSPACLPPTYRSKALAPPFPPAPHLRRKVTGEASCRPPARPSWRLLWRRPQSQAKLPRPPFPLPRYGRRLCLKPDTHREKRGCFMRPLLRFALPLADESGKPRQWRPRLGKSREGGGEPRQTPPPTSGQMGLFCAAARPAPLSISRTSAAQIGQPPSTPFGRPNTLHWGAKGGAADLPGKGYLFGLPFFFSSLPTSMQLDK